MTDILTGMMTEDQFLEQSGVKGMKWGVIRDKAAAGDRGAQKKLVKADAKWEESSHGAAAYIAVHNKVADKMNNGGIEKFNANPKYKKIKDFSDESDPKVQEYYKDYEKLTNKVFAETVKETYGTSPSGRYSAEVSHDGKGNYYAEMVDSQAVTHADTPSRLIFALTFDPSKGFTKMGDKPLPPDTLTHSAQKGQRMADVDLSGMLSEEDFLEHVGYRADMTDEEQADFLEHYGKKGMKWGHRQMDYGLGIAGKARTSTGNSKSRADGSAERSAAIDAARKRTFSGENKAAVKDAKIAYKSSKGTAGAAATKVALRAARDKKADDKHDAALAKAGREAVVVAVGGAYGHIINLALAKRTVKKG